jgi:hypothetical protein
MMTSAMRRVRQLNLRPGRSVSLGGWRTPIVILQSAAGAFIQRRSENMHETARWMLREPVHAVPFGKSVDEIRAAAHTSGVAGRDETVIGKHPMMHFADEKATFPATKGRGVNHTLDVRLMCSDKSSSALP